MITFTLGVLATTTVGILIWLTVSMIKLSKWVKSTTEEKQHIWSDIEHRHNSVEREQQTIHELTDRRIDGVISYVDSRFDKMYNSIEQNYIKKKDRLDNSIDYNN